MPARLPTALPADALTAQEALILAHLPAGHSLKETAAALYCSVDPDVHAPVPTAQSWLLGYLGTYSADRQPGLETLDRARAPQAGRPSHSQPRRLKMAYRVRLTNSIRARANG